MVVQKNLIRSFAVKTVQESVFVREHTKEECTKHPV